MTDNVNHPAHYETGKFECIEVMLETQGVEAVLNFCQCNAFKYLYRAKRKNGLEDMKKAVWYLNKYIELKECVDMVKKYRFQGHELDKAHLAKELGDVAWYLAVTAHAIGYDLETVLQMNVDKLRNRYPNGFEKERSLHRQEGDV